MLILEAELLIKMLFLGICSEPCLCCTILSKITETVSITYLNYIQIRLIITEILPYIVGVKGIPRGSGPSFRLKFI